MTREYTFTHGIKTLKFETKQFSYINDKNSLHILSLVMKSRTETLTLNCSLCNLRIATRGYSLLPCGFYNSQRIFNALGKHILSEYEVRDMLIGNKYNALYDYVIRAINFKFEYLLIVIRFIRFMFCFSHSFLGE